MIKAVIFDMDGLMFDTENLSKRMWKSLGEKNGYRFDDKLFDQVIGLDLRKTVKIFKNNFGSDFPYERLKKEKNKMMLDQIRKNGIPIKKGLKKSIKYLKENNISIAVASSSNKSTIKFYLESADLENEFDYIIGGDEVKNSKPNPEIFLNCYKKLGLPKEDILILEDSINGIKAADKAGIKVILIPDLVKIPEKIEKLTYEKLNDLTEIPQVLKNINN